MSHNHHNHKHHSHSHGHHHHDAKDMKGWKIGVSILLNIIITVGQVIGAGISGSVALMTDALHNFSDVISLVISYVANKLTLKKATTSKTYGYKRAEILAAFINSATLIGVAIFLIIEAIERFSSPIEIQADIVIWFAIASIVINFLSVVILHKDSKDNMNIRSAYLHLLTDVMTSIAVMFGGFAMKYYNVFWIDGLLTLLIATYLIYSSFALLKETTKVLMQFTPEGINLDEINTEISKIEGIKNLHHLHVWQLNDNKFMFEAHVEMDVDIMLSEFQEKLKEIENILHKFGIDHTNIQPELNKCEKNDGLIVNG
jgi:cobalt-zinc-cadmium efflux system protein